MFTLFLLDFGDPWGGPHPGPDHFPGFFFGPSIFWMLLIGFFVMRMASRHHARPTRSHRPSRPVTPPPAAPSDSSTLWPDLDSASPTQQPSEDDFVPKGKIEYF
jgi:hypothetical protein